MTARKSLYSLTAILLTVAGVGLAVFSPKAPGAVRQPVIPVIKNLTESFQVLDAEKRPAGDDEGKYFDAVVRAKNVSTKGITAYSIYYGPPSTKIFHASQTADFAIGGRSIAPGQTEEIEVLLHNEPGRSEQEEIIILAIVFDDKSSEGDFAASAAILNNRIGERDALSRINVILEGFRRHSSDRELPGSLQEARNTIAALPEASSLDSEAADSIKGGFHAAKQRVLMLLDSITEWDKKSPEERSRARLMDQLSESRTLREALANLE